MSGMILNLLSAPTAALNPSARYRRWDEALLAAIPTFLLVTLLIAWLLWRPLPGSPVTPDGGLLWQLAHYPQLLAWSLEPHAPLRVWADNPASYDVSPAAVHLRLLPAFLLGLLAGGWVLRAGLRVQSLTRHVSGPQLLEGKEAEAAALRLAALERGGKPGWLSLHPALDLPRRRWTRHVLIYGSVGSGKTQIIWPILAQLVERNRAAKEARKRPAKAFVLDVKGDFTAALPEAAIFSPFDARGRYWDIAADVRTSSQASAFAASIIPTDDLGANQYFAVAAQLILTGCIRALQKTRSTEWTWADLDLLLSLSAKQLEPVLGEHYTKAHPIVSGSESATGSVMSTLAAFTQVIGQLAEAYGEGLDKDGKPRKRLSLTAWARDDYPGRPMIVAQAGPDRQLTQRYLAAAINILVASIISPALPDDTRKNGRTIVFALDELTAIGKIELAPLVDKGRSKGVSVIAGLQDMAQVEAVYGPHFAKALPGMVGTHIIAQTQLGETRDQIAQMLGSRRVAITVPGEASTSTHEEMRQLVQPTDLTEKLGVRKGGGPAGFRIRALAQLGGDLLVLDWPGQALPRKRKEHVPAAWTLPQAVRKPLASDVPPAAIEMAQAVAHEIAPLLTEEISHERT